MSSFTVKIFFKKNNVSHYTCKLDFMVPVIEFYWNTAILCVHCLWPLHCTSTVCCLAHYGESLPNPDIEYLMWNNDGQRNISILDIMAFKKKMDKVLCIGPFKKCCWAQVTCAFEVLSVSTQTLFFSWQLTPNPVKGYGKMMTCKR